MSEQTFKILSLDGGGSWALIQVRALMSLFDENMPGREILSNFDLVAANSGGSIVAAGLAANMTLTRMNSFFMDPDSRNSVFVEKWDAELFRIFGLGPRYKTDAKLEGLRKALAPTGDMKLGDIPALIARDSGATHFIITSFDYDRQRAVFFRSDPNSAAQSSAVSPMPTLGEAVHASSTAPVNYFDKPAIFPDSEDRRRFWDGGTAGLNNPVLAAVTEALAYGKPRENIKVLTIGTGSVCLPLENDDVHPPLAVSPAETSTIGDIKKLSKTIVEDPPDAATFISHVALGQPLTGSDGKPPCGNLVRLNPLIQPLKDAAGWSLPRGLTESEFENLVKMDMDATEQDEINLIAKFCDLWKGDNIPNQPIRSGQDFNCDIGHARFSEALAHWKSIF